MSVLLVQVNITINHRVINVTNQDWRSLQGRVMALAKNKWSLTEEQSKFAIDNPEPQMAFALCCGARSSPAVSSLTLLFRGTVIHSFIRNVMALRLVDLSVTHTNALYGTFRVCQVLFSLWLYEFPPRRPSIVRSESTRP